MTQKLAVTLHSAVKSRAEIAELVLILAILSPLRLSALFTPHCTADHHIEAKSHLPWCETVVPTSAHSAGGTFIHAASILGFIDSSLRTALSFILNGA